MKESTRDSLGAYIGAALGFEDPEAGVNHAQLDRRLEAGEPEPAAGVGDREGAGAWGLDPGALDGNAVWGH